MYTFMYFRSGIQLLYDYGMMLQEQCASDDSTFEMAGQRHTTTTNQSANTMSACECYFSLPLDRRATGGSGSALTLCAP